MREEKPSQSSVGEEILHESISRVVLVISSTSKHDSKSRFLNVMILDCTALSCKTLFLPCYDTMDHGCVVSRPASQPRIL